MTTKEETRTLSIRIPERYCQQLEFQSQTRGISLNAHLLRIIEVHLKDSGFSENTIKSLSGRLFDLYAEFLKNPQGNYLASRFDIREVDSSFSRDKRRAYYIIGAQEELFDHIDEQLHEEVVKSLGFAVLNYFNRSGWEIDQLFFKRDQAADNVLVLTQADMPKGLEQFLRDVRADRWDGKKLAINTGESQDIRCGRRNEEDLYR